MATKKQKFDAMVSLFGTLLELAVSFFTALKKKGVSLAEAVVRLASDPKAQEEIVAILARLAPGAIWTVTSDGRNVLALIAALQAKGRRVSNWAKDIMSKPAFMVSRGVTYRLVVIRGDEFSDEERTTANISAEAERRRYRKPPAEVAVLLREKFTQEELGFPYVVVMHEPICASDERPNVLGLYRNDGDEWLNAWFARPEDRWIVGIVFVFFSPQES